MNIKIEHRIETVDGVVKSDLYYIHIPSKHTREYFFIDKDNLIELKNKLNKLEIK